MEKKAFLAGNYGAIILIFVFSIMSLLGLIERPGFVANYREFFTSHPFDFVPAAILFALSGGIWGYLYGLLFKPNVQTGIFYGFAPTLWNWVVVPYALGKPLFAAFALKGMVLPVIFNMLVWGAFIGWYLQKYGRPRRAARSKQKRSKKR
jgi:hypothetical protein